MFKTVTWRLLAVLLFLLAGFSYPQGGGAAPSQPVRFDTDSIVIETDSGKHALNVELATDEEQREQGLMGRKDLAPDSGMLFIFDGANYVAMWMKDTFVPLDMIFIDSRGRVARVVENTTPQSEAIISSQTPVRAVLEVKAGTAAKLKVEPGSVVRYKVFGNAG